MLEYELVHHHNFSIYLKYARVRRRVVLCLYFAIGTLTKAIHGQRQLHVNIATIQWLNQLLRESSKIHIIKLGNDHVLGSNYQQSVSQYLSQCINVDKAQHTLI